ncbi:MAG: hypothetical protein WC553_03185 [Patescibacteria group bacterium]|jgi:hypothetical protein
MQQSAEGAVRIAILSEPSAFGLSLADVNPMLLYQLRKDDPEYSEHGTTELWELCFDAVNELLHAKVIEVFAGANRRKDELVQQVAVAETQPKEQPAPAKPNGKAKSSGKEAEASNGNSNRGGKLTVKQLRYLGFLHRKVGEEPDYIVISALTQSQATMRIKELEQRVNG